MSLTFVEATSAGITVKFRRRMGLGYSTEVIGEVLTEVLTDVLTEDEINKEEVESIKKERNFSKKMGKEKTSKKMGKEMKGRNSSKKLDKVKMEMKTGGNMEERRVLALESMADSMDTLVRTSMIAMMREMVMETYIEVQLFKW